MDNIICKTFCLIYEDGGTCLFIELIIYADVYIYLHNFFKIYAEEVTCIFVELIIYADGYDHLHNFLFNLCRRKTLFICFAIHKCRWIWSSVKLIGCSLHMYEIICTCIYDELISVQMDKFLCNYTCLVLIYMQMDVVICTSYC